MIYIIYSATQVIIIKLEYQAQIPIMKIFTLQETLAKAKESVKEAFIPKRPSFHNSILASCTCKFYIVFISISRVLHNDLLLLSIYVFIYNEEIMRYLYM